MSISMMVRNNAGQFVSGTTIVNSVAIFAVKIIATTVLSKLAAIALERAATKAAEKMEQSRRDAINNSENVISL